MEEKLKHRLKVYQKEPLGWLLVDRLHLPIPVITAIFVLLYFGVMLALHNIVGHRTPTNLQELFGYPQTGDYYYPNIIGIAYDVIANPFYFVFLLILRHYLPRQFSKLAQEDLITEKDPTSFWVRLTQIATDNQYMQIFGAFAIPLLGSLGFGVLYIQIFQPADTPGKYAVFLTLIGNYAKIAVLVQLAYIFLILNSYSIKVRINLNHPDRCSGLAPFGNLAVATYLYLFFLAIFQAIGTVSGGGAPEQFARQYLGSPSVVYFWLVFPLLAAIVFNQLVYRPHRTIVALQRQNLEKSSQEWTAYHQSTSAALKQAIVSPQEAPTANDFSEQADLLQTWANLDQYIAEMHTWPISKSTFRFLTILVNPFIPLLIPVVADFVMGLFS